jgi:hypothetical protein
MTSSRGAVELAVGVVLLVVCFGGVGVTVASPVADASVVDSNSTDVQAESTVTVYVQTQDNESLRNARVHFNNSGSVVAEGYTDSLGSFTTTVPNDEYTVTVQTGVGESQSKVVTVEEDTVVEFAVVREDGTHVSYVDFSMNVQGRHTGCALDADYKIENTGDMPFTKSGSVGEDGRLATKLPVVVASSLDEIQPTPYRFIIENGDGYDEIDRNRSIDNTTHAHVSLDPTKSDVTVDANAKVAGETEPAEGATVTLRGRCRNSNAIAVQEQRAQVDETGTVTFDRLPPANYTVVVEKHGYKNAVRHVTVDPGESKQVSPQLNLSQPSSLTTAVDELLNFTESQQVTRPFEGVTLTITGGNTDLKWTRSTDANGEYTLEQLPPGQYSVAISKPDETRQGATIGWERQQYTTNLSLDEDKTISVGLHRTLSRVDTTAVHREKRAREPMFARFEYNGPAAGTELQLEHVETGTVVSVTPDEVGGITQALPTGAYDVWTDGTVDRGEKTGVTLQTNLVEARSSEDSGTPDSPARLNLDDGTNWTPDTGVVLVPRLDTLVFDVYRNINDPANFFDEIPVLNATVTVTDADGDTVTNQTNFHGKIVVPRIAPGEATVEIQKEGYETATTTVEVSEWSSGQGSAQLAAGDLAVTEERTFVSPTNGGEFEFTIEEWDNCDEQTGENGAPFCAGEDGYQPDSGLLIVTHRDEGRIERFATFVSDDDTLGPFPEGEYEIYFQDDTHDEATEHVDDVCKADERIYQLNPILEGGSTTAVEFRYDKNETEAAPDELPLVFRIVNGQTDEPIETQGTAAEIRVDNQMIPDFCEFREDPDAVERRETNGSPFDTDAAGRPLDRQFVDPLTNYEVVPAPIGTIENVEVLDQPYAAIAEGLDVSATPGNIWTFHFAPNAAEVTGDITDTESGDQLSDVQVEIGSLSDTTGGDGTYSIPGVPNGDWKMTFSKEKYYSETRDVTVGEVEPGGSGEGYVTVTKPLGGVEMEALPEPEVSNPPPIAGTFLDDVPLTYEWNVTIEEWALDTSRPGGDDAIESVEFYAEVDGESRLLETKQVELRPEDLPVEKATTVDITELTDSLAPGEFARVDRFYVVLTTRRLGELEYGERDEIGVARIIATPRWLSKTQTLVRENEDDLKEEVGRKKKTAVDHIEDVFENKAIEAKLERKVKERLPDENVVDVESTVVRDAIGGYVTGADVPLMAGPIQLPDMYQAQGIGFTAEKVDKSARYKVGYKLMTGLTYPLPDNVRAKVGLGRLGLPRADAAMWMNGTIKGGNNEWDSELRAQANVSALVSDHYTTLPAPLALLPFNVASGEASLRYDERSKARLPEDDTAYESEIVTEGSVRVAVWDIIEMAADIKTKGLAQLAPPYADVLLDWDLQAKHEGSGPPFKDSESAVMVTDGDGYQTPHNASVGVEMRYGVAVAERGFASAGGCGYDFRRLAQNIFSKVTGANQYAPCGVDVTLVNLSSSYPFFERMEGNMTLLSIEGEVLGGGGFWPSGSKELWTEPIKIRMADGSPSTVEFVEIPTSVMELDRWWLSLPNYDTVEDWSEEGTLLNDTYPYADPSVAVRDDQVELLAGIDGGTDSYVQSLGIRRFTGTVEGLDTTGELSESTGGVSPAVALDDAGDGGLAAFTRFEETGAFTPTTLQTGDLYIAQRSDGSWGTPQQVTDSPAFHHGATIEQPGDGEYVIAWKAAHGNPLNGSHTRLAYAAVSNGTVQDHGTVIDGGVTAEPALACTSEQCLVAAPVRQIGASGRPTSTVVYSTIGDGTATEPARIDRGTFVDVAATNGGFDVVLGDPGGIDHVRVEGNTVSDQELVADVLPRDLAVVEGSDGPVAIWSNSETAALEYATHGESNWTEPETITQDTFHTSVTATADPASETILVATTSTPLSEESSIDVDLYTVSTETRPPVVVDNRPTDPDGDGQYEDINGDDKFDIFDVIVLYNHLDNPAVTENPQYFDFDGDDAVEIDISDVQALFSDLPQQYQDLVTNDYTVETPGLRNGIEHWRSGTLETDELRLIIKAWRTGDKIYNG